MPICTVEECTQYAAKKQTRCHDHLSWTPKEVTAHARKLKLGREAAEKRQAEQDKRNQKSATKIAQHKRATEFKAEVMRSHKAEWEREINSIIAEVEKLRVTDPSANAGSNKGGTTLGGTNNPLQLSLSGPTHGVTKGEILSSMHGFDSSDSGLFKFRRGSGGTIFVHCK